MHYVAFHAIWGLLHANNVLCTVEPLNNGHIGDRSHVLCREVVPISEVGIEQTRSQTTICLASLVPRLPHLGAPAPIAYGRDNAIGRLLTSLCLIGIDECVSHRGTIRSWRLFMYVQLHVIILESVSAHCME